MLSFVKYYSSRGISQTPSCLWPRPPLIISIPSDILESPQQGISKFYISLLSQVRIVCFSLTTPTLSPPTTPIFAISISEGAKQSTPFSLSSLAWHGYITTISPLDSGNNLLTTPHIFVLFCFCWGKIALQCYVSFCCTAKWMSYTYTYIPSLLGLPPSPSPSHPSRSSQGTELSSLCYTAGSHQLSILQMVVHIPHFDPFQYIPNPQTHLLQIQLLSSRPSIKPSIFL